MTPPLEASPGRLPGLRRSLLPLPYVHVRHLQRQHGFWRLSTARERCAWGSESALAWGRWGRGVPYATRLSLLESRPPCQKREESGMPGRALVHQVCLYAGGELHVGTAKEKYQLFIRKISGIRHARAVTLCPTARREERPHGFWAALGQELSVGWGTGRCLVPRLKLKLEGDLANVS
jgi:hypothetical protein